MANHQIITPIPRIANYNVIHPWKYIYIMINAFCLPNFQHLKTALRSLTLAIRTQSWQSQQDYFVNNLLKWKLRKSHSIRSNNSDVGLCFLNKQPTRKPAAFAWASIPITKQQPTIAHLNANNCLFRSLIEAITNYWSPSCIGNSSIPGEYKSSNPQQFQYCECWFYTA